MKATKKAKARRSVRVSKQALLAIALQDMFAELSADIGAQSEEWFPDMPVDYDFFFVPFFMGDDEEAGGEQDDDSDETGADEEKSDEQSMFFSHTTSRENGLKYLRSFSNVQDFINQPFANAKNEQLWRDEEFPDGKYRSWDKTHLRPGQRDATKNETWYGAATGEAAADRAVHGWVEGAEKIRSMLGGIEAPPPVDVRRKVNHGDQGDELDVHKVYSGNLDKAWTRRRRQSSRARMNARVIVPLGGSMHQTQEDMFWRGAAVVKLAELLEESGYRVELLACDLTDADNGKFSACASFCMKEAGAQLDVEQVAGVLCNAGFFRTHCFRALYAMAEHDISPTVHEKEMRYVRNKAVPTGKTFKRTLLARSHKWGRKPSEEMGLLNDGVLTFQASNWIADRERAESWVKKCLAQLGADVQKEETADADD